MVRFIRRMALSTFPSSTTTPTYDRFFCADEMMKLLFCNNVRVVVVVDAEERRGVVWRKALQEEKVFKEGFKSARNGKEEEDDDDDDDDLKECDESALSLPLFKHDDDDEDDDEDDDDDESILEKTFARRNIIYLNLSSSSSLCVFLCRQRIKTE